MKLEPAPSDPNDRTQPNTPTSGWRIPRPHLDQVAATDYQSVHGWGWLGPIGLALTVAAVIGLVRSPGGLWAAAVAGGMFVIVLGAILNGFSERKRMVAVDGRCLDHEVRPLIGTRQRSSGWGVRALVEFEHEGRTHQITPERNGYLWFATEENARRFAERLAANPRIQLLIKPHRPQNAFFAERKGKA